MCEEILLVEKEQEQLDKEAIILEKNLRDIMFTDENGENKSKEDEYIKQWFLLINQKSALIHRQLELETL